MALVRANEEYVAGRSGIRFLMQDRAREVPCSISFQVLSAFGRAVGSTDVIGIFVNHRADIERAASDVYDQTEPRDFQIVTITNDDLATRSELIRAPQPLRI
jgi:Protein of unknown function (DUF1488)